MIFIHIWGNRFDFIIIIGVCIQKSFMETTTCNTWERHNIMNSYHIEVQILMISSKFIRLNLTFFGSKMNISWKPWKIHSQYSSGKHESEYNENYFVINNEIGQAASLSWWLCHWNLLCEFLNDVQYCTLILSTCQCKA